MDESKLLPFDLERARAGDKVLVNFLDGFPTVIHSEWKPDEYGAIAVLHNANSNDNSGLWVVAEQRHLRMAPRMAPRTKTVWYAFFRLFTGEMSTAHSFVSESDLRSYLNGCKILAIHSMEVPE